MADATQRAIRGQWKRTVAHLFGVSISFECTCIEFVYEAINLRFSRVVYKISLQSAYLADHRKKANKRSYPKAWA